MTKKKWKELLADNDIKIFEEKKDELSIAEDEGDEAAYSGIKIQIDKKSFNIVIEINADYDDTTDYKDIDDPEESLEDMIDQHFGEAMEDRGFFIHNTYKYGDDHDLDDDEDEEDRGGGWGMTVEYLREFEDNDIEEALEIIEWGLTEEFWLEQQ
ncbi:MAG: hypothetical protein KAS39_08140 [Actinomycetia bacterium]|nr:hypothetical protein [Actinomycetes bacterium]